MSAAVVSRFINMDHLKRYNFIWPEPEAGDKCSLTGKIIRFVCEDYRLVGCDKTKQPLHRMHWRLHETDALDSLRLDQRSMHPGHRFNYRWGFRCGVVAKQNCQAKNNWNNQGKTPG